MSTWKVLVLSSTKIPENTNSVHLVSPIQVRYILYLSAFTSQSIQFDPDFQTCHNAGMKKVIVIGGGIAGLAAAYRIQEEIKNKGQVSCTVLEGSDRLGGKIHTIRRDGFILERGPDSFISQKPAVVELCKKLGIDDHLMGTRPTTRKPSFISIVRWSPSQTD